MFARVAVLMLSTLLAEVLGCWAIGSEYPPPSAASETLARRMRETIRADYRGQTDRLLELHAAMARDTADTEFGRWAHYWRGFARWRRAMNLLNENPKSTEALDDLRVAARDFARAEAWPELAADARAARAACILSLGAMSGNPDSIRAAIRDFGPLIHAAVEAEPDNPRVLWVQSGSLFYAPVSRGGGPDAAIRVMERGLERARAEAGRTVHELAPRWGEAESHMNLAWAWSSRPDPDLTRADQYAREALRLVPDWHYVRDILVPKIREARRNVQP